MCLDNYIGIRGECKEAKLFLDDLPGIDIVKASKITNETHPRPINLVEKAFNQAKKEVLQDILSNVKLKYNRIVDEKAYLFAGTYKYYGENTDIIKIKIWKTNNDRFLKITPSEFEIISDRNITKDFIVSDGYGIQKVISKDLEIGLNSIFIDFSSRSEFITITFTLDDFKIGIKETRVFSNQTNTCLICEIVNSYCDCTYLEINKEIGFNIAVKCEVDECKLLEYLTPTIDLPLLYKTGINYLIEAKMSGRINAYLRNTEEAIENILTLWMGGYDNVNDTKVPSMYWQKVKQVSSSINNLLAKLHSPIFSFEGMSICNTLP